MATTPIIAPDGTVADVPNEHVTALVQKGGIVGVDMLSPDGKEMATVPQTHAQDLLKRGASFAPPPGTPGMPKPPDAIEQDTKKSQAAMAAGPFAPAGAAEDAIANASTITDAAKGVGHGLTYGVPAAVAPESLLGRVLLNAAASGGESAISGDSAKRVAGNAAVGAGVQGATEALPFLAPYLKNAAVGQYKRALAPTTKINKSIAADIAPELINRGVSGSLSSIENQAKSAAQPLRQPLDAAYSAIPSNATAGSGAKIVQDLESLKGKYVVNGVPSQPAAVNAISGVQDIIQQHGADISPTSLRQLKQIFDDPVASQGGYAGADLSAKYALKAQKAAANSIRTILHQASPDVAQLDKELSFWLNVQKVTRESGLRRTGQEGGLVKVFGPLAAGAAGSMGYAAGGLHGGLEAALGTAGATAFAQAVRSPAWRTLSAVQKSRIADSLANGTASDLARILSRTLVQNGNQQASPTNQLQAPPQ